LLSHTGFIEAAEPTDGRIAIEKEILELDGRFHAISLSLLDCLEETGVKPSQVRKHIAILPTSLFKEAGQAIDEVADKFESKRTLTGLFSFLNATLWNFIDYHLLKYVIERFGSVFLKMHMDQYVQDLEVFESHISVHDLIEFWPGQDNMPKKYSEASVKIDKDPKVCTLAELNVIRQKLFVAFWPPLSEYAKLVMHFKKFLNGCFVVVWVLPSYLATELAKAINSLEVQALLEENQVLSLSVQNKVLYVGPSQITRESSPACKSTASGMQDSMIHIKLLPLYLGYGTASPSMFSQMELGEISPVSKKYYFDSLSPPRLWKGVTIR
jgi:hypothetical protein